MKRTRVAIVGLPRLLHDVVRQTILGQEDLELVAEITEPVEVDDLAACPHIEVAVVTAESTLLSSLGHLLLMSRPRLRVVEIAPEGNRAARYELKPERTPIPDVSLEGLLCAIRAAARNEVDDG